MADIIATVDIMVAKIAMISFLIVVAKFVTKRVGAKSADRFLMKIHRPAGYILAVTGLIHSVLSFCVFSTTPIMVYILGIVCTLSILAAIATFIFRKKLVKKWLLWHRITTVIALVTLVLHLMLIKTL